jgi:uncharacterized protein YjbK
MLTKGKFLELLKAVDPDPNFLVLIIKECFKRLPDAASWKLAHQLYVNYFWDKQTYKLKNNLSGEEILFTSYEEVIMYLNKLGYNVGSMEVRQAFNRRSESFCNHTFYKDEKKEITYFE